MIRLYQATGSGEITYVSHVEDSAWGKFKSLASRMLKAEGKLAAAETLEKYPFVLNEGTNFFGDEFHYLLATFKEIESASSPPCQLTSILKLPFRGGF